MITVDNSMRERKGKHNQTGAMGELVARKWLKSKGFSILADNYQQLWGEIDIVAKKGQIVHFVEVKAASYKKRSELEKNYTWRPEENVTKQKISKMHRTIDSWLRECGWEGEWQIDVAAVKLVPSEKFASINYIDNVISD